MHIEVADLNVLTIRTDASGNGFCAYDAGKAGQGIAQFPVQSSVISEACGVYFPLRQLHQRLKQLTETMRITRINIISDCKPLVKLLRALPSIIKWVGNSVLRTVLSKIVGELREMTQHGLKVTFEWHNRNGNPAHHLVERYKHHSPQTSRPQNLEPTLYSLHTKNSIAAPTSSQPTNSTQTEVPNPQPTRSRPIIEDKITVPMMNIGSPLLASN